MTRLPDAPGDVLSTLEADGSRRWLRPRVASGKFLTRRRWVAYGLMALFLLLPWIRINGFPAVFLDLAHRRFHLMGYTFLPTDTVFLALAMASLFLTIFWLTALFGRVWCGWACPQTVYLEFLFRPIERFFEGTSGRGGEPAKNLPPFWLIAKYGAFVLAALIPAHTFLAYFVGVENLYHWIGRSPFAHPTAFIVTLVTTLLMLFDFGYFREQLCILACPYGRFQSVMLDRDSLLVNYNRPRGEPRSRRGTESPAGDCVDCRNCVTCCPTGIDIREGLQMECLHCAQCIDACDTVMVKLGRSPNLIGYATSVQAEGGKRHWLRPRVVLYPLAILTLMTIAVTLFVRKGSADATLLRNFGAPFSQLPNGMISNNLRLKVTNRSDKAQRYHLSLAAPTTGQLILLEPEMRVEAGESRTCGLVLELPRNAFAATNGTLSGGFVLRDESGFQKELVCQILGPVP